MGAERKLREQPKNANPIRRLRSHIGSNLGDPTNANMNRCHIKHQRVSSL